MTEVASFHLPDGVQGAKPPSALLSRLMRIEAWLNWHAPDMDDVRDLLRRITRTPEPFDPVIDAIILRICPLLEAHAMPWIFRHAPHKFGGTTNDGGLVVVTIEPAEGTHAITFHRSVLSGAPRSAHLAARVEHAREQYPDVEIDVDGIFSKSVSAMVTLTDEQASREAMEGAVERLGDVAREVVGGASAT